ADVAAGEHRLTVVTGAPNNAKGQRLALAIAGARLIDAYSDELKYKTLKPGSIRGIRSEGMVCSEKELGLSDEHEGILVLEDDAPVGASLAEYLGDTVIEFEITPNLVHAFSVLGIAREAGAVTGSKVKPLDVVDLSTVKQVDDLVRIQAPELCPRYAALVIEGIEIAPSPTWIARRLTAAGVRPINNIVDITNYVMIEVGQPLHAFDTRVVHGGRIGVRRSQAGEKLETLDHQVRELPEDTLLIVDTEKPLGLAGIMGGVSSEVVDSTTSILLESANFDMVSIRSASRAIKLRTDASARFERGIDPELVPLALARSAALILSVCPGARLSRLQDVYPNPAGPRTITLSTAKVDAVLGIHIEPGVMVDVLERLGFAPELADADTTLVANVPSWRSDVAIAEDVIEEIARIVGYDQLPATLPTGTTPQVERDPTFLAEREIRRVMVAAGAFEARGYVTLGRADLDRWSIPASSGIAHDVGPDSLVRLRNAVQADQDILRPSIIPNLVKSVAENLKHEQSVRLFEVGHVYLAAGQDALPNEPLTLGIAFAGRRERFDRFNPSRDGADNLDFFDVKGVMEAVLSTAGAQDARWERLDHPALHPGRAASLIMDGRRIGVVAEVRPDLARALDIDDVRLVVGELDVDAFLKGPDGVTPHVGVDRFLPVEQDFAVVVDQKVAASDVESALERGAGPLLSDVVLFDVFIGEQIGEAKKSLAYRLTFTAPDRALTDGELGKVRKRIERTIGKEVGGTLRA
ncbi:MAG: phenylalanine--tRNA ligase subunit beta, partial [Chloroflexota bacterium]|nr:phenylalanine--tRNA ligase subunit beta [Chloroflexota bacterium]